MLLRIFVALVVLIALAVGCLAILGVVLPPNMMVIHMIVFRDFFDVALPILGFGALIKYLCTPACACHCGCAKSNNNH